MHRRMIMALLALGTVGGYASGFAHVAHRHHHWREHHRAAFVSDVAQACVEAARGQGASADPSSATKTEAARATAPAGYHVDPAR